MCVPCVYEPARRKNIMPLDIVRSSSESHRSFQFRVIRVREDGLVNLTVLNDDGTPKRMWPVGDMPECDWTIVLPLNCLFLAPQ